MKSKTYNAIRTTRQKGFSLLEFMIVMALIGIAAAALAWLINRGFGASDIKEESSNVTTVLAAVPEMRSNTGYGATGTNLLPALIAQGAIPTTWPVLDGVPQNAWGGVITVVSQVNRVAISSSRIPQEACAKMTTRMSRGNNFQTTQIGSASAITGEVTAAAAAAACTAENTITWTTKN